MKIQEVTHMATPAATTLNYVVSGILDAGNDKVSVALIPETVETTNEDGTKTYTQTQQNNLNFVFDTAQAKAYWPGQKVVVTIA
jgi:hypothetical protein